MADLYVEVLYNYDYTASDGKPVRIQKGDKYILLDKTTNEWWKVRRGDKEKFFVPANYVTVVSTVQPINNGLMHDSSVSESEAFSQPSSNGDSTRSNSLEEVVRLTVSSTDKLSNDCGDLTKLSLQQEASGRNGCQETVEYANMDIIQAILKQKESHSSLTCQAAAEGANCWEMHTDDDSGKPYFYNPVTKETTWEAPDFPRNNEVTMPNGNPKRLSRVHSFCKGWTEKISDSGTKSYVHNATGEKWHMTVDSSGREYYYKENSDESLWELPEIAVEELSAHEGLSIWSSSSSEPEVASLPRRLSISNLTLLAPSQESKSLGRRSCTLPANMNLTLSSEYSPKPQLSPTDVTNTPPMMAAIPTGGFKNSSLTQGSIDQQKRGFLNRAKINDGKRKVKKTWSVAFVAATGSKLIIYKDEKSAVSKPDAEFGKPEAIVDLTNSVVLWSSKDKTSRKNVIEITSASGTGYLLQHDDSILMHQWFTIIQGKVKKFNPTIVAAEDETEAENNNNFDKSKRKQHSRRLSKHGGTKSVYTLHEDNANFLSPTATGPAGEMVKTGIREKLRSFLIRRPTQESLEKQGILLAERVFGSRLQFICDREQTTVPKFVVRCIETIEQKGITIDGLYRINGNQAQIQKLRFSIDSSDEYDLKDYDINVLTGALKLFFRELKEPLIPFQLYNVLSEAIHERDASKKLRIMKLKLGTMPTVNLDTLKYLFAHLVRVHECVKENRMRSQNIAIVFGPTLMWPERESSAIAVNMICQNSIVEYILNNFDRLF